ncbi:MAG: hypothetical protein WD136_03205 [Cyanobium sp.]
MPTLNHILSIELLQIAVLATASLTFLSTAIRPGSRWRLWSLMLAMACLAGMLRELDPDLFDQPTLVLLNHIGRKVIYRLAITSAIGLLIAALICEPRGFRPLLKPALIWSWIAAIGLMAIGSLLEKQGAMLYEEIFELAGQSLVMVSAWLHRNSNLSTGI